MNETEINWDILNAYVDGELDRVMSAKVAIAVAQDATLAARIASLSKLKASATSHEIPLSQIPPFPNEFKQRHTASWRVYGIAAGLILVLAMGVLTSKYLGSRAEPRWLDAALTAQRDWIESASKHEAGDGSIVTIGATKSARPLDLSDAELKLVYVAAAPSVAGSEPMFLGYRGPHGCMVGLWIGLPQAGVGPMPQGFDSGKIRVRAWRDQGTGYALMSKGMDPVRIDRLAAAVARLVDPKQIVDDGVRTALRDVTRTGAACKV